MKYGSGSKQKMKRRIKVEIKIGQIYKRRESEALTMVTAIQHNQIYLGSGRSVSETTLERQYVLIKDVKD
jgi:hypothetical protein